MTFDINYLLPLVPTILMPSTLITTYYISVSRNEVEKFLPSISETGLFPPQSYLFIIMFNISAVFRTVYRRFKLISQFYSQRTDGDFIKKLNISSLPFGLAIALGISLVGSFKAGYSWWHMFGAQTVFFSAIIHCLTQTWMSFLMVQDGVNSLFMARLRLMLSLIITTCAILTNWYGYQADKLFHGSDQLHWKPSDGGYPEHIISSATEWTLVFCLIAAIGTAINEMDLKNRLQYKLKYFS